MRPLILALLFLASVAHAQSPNIWPSSGTEYHGTRAGIVTLDQPTLRHRCRIHAITAHAITCGVGTFHHPVTYASDHIAAIILPPTHAQAIHEALGVAAIAGAIVASFFVPEAALVIALRVGAAGFVVYYFAFTDWLEDSTDRTSDFILYQRPNTPLAIHLR